MAPSLSPDSTAPVQTVPSRGYRFWFGFFGLIFRLIFKVDVLGRERVPAEGPLLLTSNHTALLEGPLVAILSPRQPVSAMAKEEYRDQLIGKLILRYFNAIYVKRGEVDRAALKEMLVRLKQNAVLGIAPEGTRSSDGTLQEGKEGTAYLAIQSDAWIQPIAVWGHLDLGKNLRRLRRTPVYVRFGHPFKLDSTVPRNQRQAEIEAGTRRLMHSIARMLPPEMRGVYADAVQGPPDWT